MRFLLGWCVLLVGTYCAGQEGKPREQTPARPRVAGVLRLQQRLWVEKGGKRAQVVRSVDWKAAETAVIVCDMWDDHYCKSAAQRVKVMAPRMNEVLTAARGHGVLILHSPSGCMDRYADTPYRKRVQGAAPAKSPFPLKGWCHLDPKKEPPLPVDTSKCACDDPVVGPAVRRFTRQHAALDIIGYDGVGDDGQEIHNWFVQEGIRNVAIMGVHTNMCVLGRPFGIRQMVGQGKNVVLVRDLTDAMYDPRQPPFVSHARGTELVVEHIEKYWCPSIEGRDLTGVVGGTAGPEKSVTPAVP